jgi:transcriptional regulator with GAF, ATPase, and Fis domain
MPGSTPPLNRFRLFSRQNFFLAVGVFIFLYALTILCYVPFVPYLGLRSLFGTALRGVPVVAEAGDEGLKPREGDTVLQVGDYRIRLWPDLLKAPFQLDERRAAIETAIADGSIDWARWAPSDSGASLQVKVRFEDHATHAPFSAWCTLGRPPVDDLYPSFLWFFLKAFLFTVGTLVFLKRPHDDAAAVFFLLCVVTLGAYMGGYHWHHIATQPPLILTFMVCGVLLPVVSLHFYLVFPRKKWFVEKWPRGSLAAIYGPPLVVLAALMVCYWQFRFQFQHLAAADSIAAVVASSDRLRITVFVSLGFSAVWFLGSILALLHSAWTVTDPMERNQVRCLLYIGAAPALVLIAASLYIVYFDPDGFAAGATTWPMFLASACVNLAFAVSITRYRLMELDKLISSGVAYFVISAVAVLVYYGVFFLGAMAFNQVFAGPTVPEALLVSATFVVLMVVLDVARSRFQRALDRRFSRNKSQLDQTLQQMSEAVGQLVDPQALAQKFLHATAELLGVAQGAIFLRPGELPIFRLAGHVGHPPPLDELTTGFPLVEAVQAGRTLYRQPSRHGSAAAAAQRQLQFLGGELAQPLAHEGRLLAIVVLGPKDTPYRPEDVNILAALGQITVLALESAAGHQAIDHLNRELQDHVEKIAEQQRRILALQTQLRQSFPAPPADDAPPAAPPAPPAPGGIVGSGRVVRELLGLVLMVAATDAVVLVRGESGTGKELLARAIHETSPRADTPFVKVHCAALAPGLLESELFGHVKGAFTGAHRDKAGRFELAGGGTLFLDEIGDISLEVQTKLLRVLQERTVERVGSGEPIPVDVRIITATHQNLEALIREGKFREDLFYRLNVFPVRMPALRERVEDIPELATHFLARFAERFGKKVQHFDDDALAALKAHPWPGNIRQLENMIERAVVVAEGGVITLHELPPDLTEEPVAVPAAPPPAALAKTPARPVAGWKAERERQEREQLVRALAAADGNKAEAARALGVARSTLISRLKKLGLA